MHSILRQHLRSLRPVSEDCTSSLTSDLLEILEPCNGLLLGELLIKCGILSKADLVTVSWFSKYGLYEAVLRAAMGMFSEDRNWTALHRMRTYYLTDPDVYGGELSLVPCDNQPAKLKYRLFCASGTQKDGL